MQIFVLHVMFLLTAPIFKNSQILASVYFTFRKTHVGANFKDFSYRISTSEKDLISKTNI